MSPFPGPLPALRTQPKAIFFTDFDGTITLEDSNDFLSDNLGYGEAPRLAANKLTLEGKQDFRKTFSDMMEHVKTPLDECVRQLLANIKLDPKFKEFHTWCKANNIPIVVISGGMKPVITALLGHLLGEAEVLDMQIVSNDVKPKPGKSVNDEDGWVVEYHDDSGFGHDKSLELKPYAELKERPVMFYAGDGVSDLSAARHTDLLFAKCGKDLITYCERENIPFTEFNDFGDIHKVVADVVDGTISVKEAAAGRTMSK